MTVSLRLTPLALLALLVSSAGCANRLMPPEAAESWPGMAVPPVVTMPERPTAPRSAPAAPSAPVSPYATWSNPGWGAPAAPPAAAAAAAVYPQQPSPPGYPQQQPPPAFDQPPADPQQGAPQGDPLNRFFKPPPDAVFRGQSPDGPYSPPRSELIPGSRNLLREPMPVSGQPVGPPERYSQWSEVQPAQYAAPAVNDPWSGTAVPPPPPPYGSAEAYPPAPAPTTTFQPPPYQPPGGYHVLPGAPPPASLLPPPPVGTVPPLGPLLPESPFERTADIDVILQETQTGRLMFGVGVNSDAGLTGQIVVDERNFDIWRPPTSFRDFLDGTAFRGGGQTFRLEAMPGTSVQRYMVSLTEPYLFGTPISFSVSGYYYDRRYFDWDENRLGARLGLGYRLTPDLSVSSTIQAENVRIGDVRVPAVLGYLQGDHDLYTARFAIAHDTRDIPFAASEGHFIELAYEQAFGEFDFPRGELDIRKYFLMLERPDGSGRHTLSYVFRLGVSGSDTPVFENYFAGGYSTMRGFDFRGASPKDSGVVVGGRFRFLGSVEYMFPITADDMLRSVIFCDFGTVEQSVAIRGENYRVAPGFGLRLFIPAMGPAPLAFDFAFPVAKADTDDTQVFSFFIGIGR